MTRMVHVAPAHDGKHAILHRLLEVFRRSGFDGASLAEISAATGLGKSSLYHHFPDGKADMARQVLGHLEQELSLALFRPLQAANPPAEKLKTMLDAIDAFYEGGKLSCLLERLTASVDRKDFERPLGRAFAGWIEAVEALCREAGLPRKLARQRAEDLVIRIEGALVVGAGMRDPAVFKRTLEQLGRSLLVR